MNTPLAYNAVPMAPSATRTRLPRDSRNSAARVCVTVVGISSVKNLAERDLDRGILGAKSAVVFNQTKALGSIAEGLLRFRIQHPHIPDAKREIVGDLLLHPAHP